MLVDVLLCKETGVLGSKVVVHYQLLRKKLLMKVPTVDSCCGALRLRVAAILIGFLNMLLDVVLITGVVHLVFHPEYIAIHTSSQEEQKLMRYRIHIWALVALTDAMFGTLADIILLNAACAWQASGAFLWSGVAVARFFVEGGLAATLLVRCAVSGGGCAPFAAAALARILIDGLNLYFGIVTFSLGEKYKEIGLQQMDPNRVRDQKLRGEKLVDISGV